LMQHVFEDRSKPIRHPGIRWDDDQWVERTFAEEFGLQTPIHIWFSDIRKARVGLRNS
jgi:hypothetical protein